MIILVGGEKGGTGKTTLATNLAVMRAAQRRDVLLVDTDPQGSASSWFQIREELGLTPRVHCIQKFGKGVTSTLSDLSKRYDDLIVDAGGRDSVELRAAMVVADRLLIPIQPSQFDVWTLERMEGLIDMALGFNPELESRVVINRASPHPGVNEVENAQTLLRETHRLSLTGGVLRDRIAFRKAAMEGMAVTELKPIDGKAVAEMKTLFREVFS